MATILLKGIIVVIAAKTSLCTITGISYMDPLNFRRNNNAEGSNPCNPLYWYPQNIPEYCYTTTTEPPKGTPPPPVIPLPIPVPFPPMMPPLLPPSLPFGVPIVPSGPMLPVAGASYPAPYPYSPFQTQQQVGMVPGLPGLVSPDGGINLMPFSDAYSDMLEKHKNKLIRKRMKSVLKEFEDYPRMRRFTKHGKYIRIKYN